MDYKMADLGYVRREMVTSSLMLFTGSCNSSD